MIIYDFSNIVIGAAMDYFNETKQQPDLPLMRHMALMCIIKDKEKKSRYVGSLGTVLAFDGGNYWRKDIFPNYKQNRKKAQSKMDFDFAKFYQDFNQIKEEFKQVLPYHCIEVPKAEADDIIAVLARKFAAHETVCIVGSDKDFLQIQEWDLANPVVQYSPWHKKFLTKENRDLPLIQHICGGDKSDGIPNIWSDVDTFMTEGMRQKPFTKKLKEQVDAAGFGGIESLLDSDELVARFNINKNLIDLELIPEYIVDKIIYTYETTQPAHGQFHNYLVTHKLRKLMEMAKV